MVPDGGSYSGSIKLIYTLGLNPFGNKPINREMVEAIAHDVASALRDRLHTVSGIASVGTAEIEIDESESHPDNPTPPTEVRDRGLERLIGGPDQHGRYAPGTKGTTTANIKGETAREREIRETGRDPEKTRDRDREVREKDEEDEKHKHKSKADKDR